jgi:hypothetical protein
MAEFDKSLDKELFGEEAKFETSKLRVSVMCYNEGMKKIQISRENLDPNSGDYRWTKLGRMTKEEASKVAPLLQKAADFIE